MKMPIVTCSSTKLGLSRHCHSPTRAGTEQKAGVAVPLTLTGRYPWSHSWCHQKHLLISKKIYM